MGVVMLVKLEVVGDASGDADKTRLGLKGHQRGTTRPQGTSTMNDEASGDIDESRRGL